MHTFSLLDVDGLLDPRRTAHLRRAVGLFGLLLVVLTWRMWLPQEVFPQVPLVPGGLPAAVQWLALVSLLAGLAGMLVAPAGRLAQAALLLYCGGLLVAVAADQQRFQPWAYQFALIALVLAVSRPLAALGLMRVLVVGFYLASAVTKLDYSFLHTLGQQFLGVLVERAGGALDNWAPGSRLAAAAVFPVGELLVAVGLALARTRRLALLASLMLHAMLLVILGPLGLGHKPGVLAWNAYFMVQNVLLFWEPRQAPAIVSPADRPVVEQHAAPRSSRLGVAVVAVAIVWSWGEPWGWCDTWPGWGLYASSAERVVLLVHRRGRDQLPERLAAHLEEPADPQDPWLTLRLDRWALDALDAPIYPQARVQLGVAEAVAAGGLAQRARAVRLSRADRWSGERAATVISGPAEWAAVHREYWLNSRPAANRSGNLPER